MKNQLYISVIVSLLLFNCQTLTENDQMIIDTLTVKYCELNEQNRALSVIGDFYQDEFSNLNYELLKYSDKSFAQYIVNKAKLTQEIEEFASKHLSNHTEVDSSDLIDIAIEDATRNPSCDKIEVSSNFQVENNALDKWINPNSRSNSFAEWLYMSYLLTKMDKKTLDEYVSNIIKPQTSIDDVTFRFCKDETILIEDIMLHERDKIFYLRQEIDSITNEINTYNALISNNSENIKTITENDIRDLDRLRDIQIQREDSLDKIYHDFEDGEYLTKGLAWQEARAKLDSILRKKKNEALRIKTNASSIIQPTMLAGLDKLYEEPIKKHQDILNDKAEDWKDVSQIINKLAEKHKNLNKIISDNKKKLLLSRQKKEGEITKLEMRNSELSKRKNDLIVTNKVRTENLKTLSRKNNFSNKIKCTTQGSKKDNKHFESAYGNTDIFLSHLNSFDLNFGEDNTKYVLMSNSVDLKLFKYKDSEDYEEKHLEYILPTNQKNSLITNPSIVEYEDALYCLVNITSNDKNSVRLLKFVKPLFSKNYEVKENIDVSTKLREKFNNKIMGIDLNMENDTLILRFIQEKDGINNEFMTNFQKHILYTFSLETSVLEFNSEHEINFNIKSPLDRLPINWFSINKLDDDNSQWWLLLPDSKKGTKLIVSGDKGNSWNIVN